MGLGDAINKRLFPAPENEGETEEERRKRLAREAASKANPSIFQAKKNRIDGMIAQYEDK